MSSDEDVRFMQMAINLAKRSRSEGGVHPLVGAVVTKKGQLLGSAYRGKGKLGDHAEYVALERALAGEDLIGATVYTTLEPCTTRNHPKVPCAKRLAERGISRVVIGMLDPNQNICGRGIRELRNHGVSVELFPSQLMKQVEVQNRVFTRTQESMEKRLIACGVGQRYSPYEFSTFADRRTRSWILVAQNLRTLLHRPEFLRHVRRLLEGGTRITIVLSTPESMKVVGDVAAHHLEQSVDDLRRFYLSLKSPTQRQRLVVHFNRGASSLSVQVRDPDNPARALLVFAPKWSTDSDPENRLYFVLDRREHDALFRKLYGPILAMTHADSPNLRKMCETLKIRWKK
jgi:pyrimidine deaminase RibD-like protein